MPYPHILHHGAVNGVTDSCHQLQMDALSSLLIDCGLFQGNERTASGVIGALHPHINFALAGIKALEVTHVHADHVRRIPYLLAAGFRGPIVCSEPSAKLLPLVLEDAFRLELSREPAHIDRYMRRLKQQIIAVPFNQWGSIVKTDTLQALIRLQRAGHILGSAYVECDLDYPQSGLNRRVVFSGDLGAPHTPLLPAQVSPERADVLILESTYGDRVHEDRATRQSRLERAIDKALADQGTLLIPAFAIGRTQELLYDIEDILYRKTLLDPSLPVNWPQLPIILDSRLASRLPRVYRDLSDYWDEEAQARLKSGRRLLHFKQMVTVDGHARYLQAVNYLASTGRPAIVIAAGGMCSSGRIVNHLKAMLEDQRHNVLFIGYQAQGAPGAAIQKYGQPSGYVELEGKRCIIRAGFSTLGGYSAHADQHDLLAFVSGKKHWPEQINLVHGEIMAKQVFAKNFSNLYHTQNRFVEVRHPGELRGTLLLAHALYDGKTRKNL